MFLPSLTFVHLVWLSQWHLKNYFRPRFLRTLSTINDQYDLVSNSKTKTSLSWRWYNFVSGFVEHHCDVHIAEPLTFMGKNLISLVSHTIDDTETYP